MYKFVHHHLILLAHYLAQLTLIDITTQLISESRNYIICNFKKLTLSGKNDARDTEEINRNAHNDENVPQNCFL